MAKLRFLKAKHINKHKIINDPVHGFITIPSEIIFDLIEHRYFQRLRRISQTGLTHYVYPGATHTRFLHALGAMHLMQVSLDTLRKKKITISEEEYESACIAILLHDIGHGPFSHALESTLMEDCHHEVVSIALIRKLNEEFNGRLSMALEMFLGKYTRPFFNQLISSQVDVDRLDYLKRDSFFSGVSEGNVNSERIITMMNVADDQLVFDEKGIYSIEKYLVSRMFMYWQVYYHKTSLTAESLLIHVLQRAKEVYQEGKPLETSDNLMYFLSRSEYGKLSDETLEKFTQLDDSDIFSTLKQWATNPDRDLALLSLAVTNRSLPKSKFVQSPLSDQVMQKCEIQVSKELNVSQPQYFIEQRKIEVLPYSEKKPIRLLTKKSEIIPLHLHPEQTLSLQLAQPNQKYHLYYPRELMNSENSYL